MKRIFRLCLLLLFLSISIKFYAQNDGLQNIVPPSPRTTEFNKFIDYKVSIANGLPEININFYNIVVDGNTISIGISYHASGIKYGQTSGDVGLGWSLSPGYRASRTVYGLVDEISTMPNMNNVSGGQTILYYLNNSFATPLARDQYLARYVKLSPGDDIPLVTATAADYLDGQFDLFTVGLPEQDSKFIITDRPNKVITQLSNNPLKISYTTGMDGLISGFNIVGGNGTKYKLGQSLPNSENLQVMVGGQMKKYSNAWLLSELKTHLGKTITFNYATTQESSIAKPGSGRSFIDGAYYRNAITGTLYDCYVTRNPGVQFSAGSTNLYNISLLTSIMGVEENVTIIRNGNGTINSILIKRNQDNEQLKKVTFFYSTFYGKIFLDSLYISGKTDESSQRYLFEYESRNINYTSYDCFGYYQSNQVAIAQFAPKITFPFIGISRSEPGDCQENYTASYNEGENKEHLYSKSVYMLKKITYPSGGSTTYSYESNVYKDPLTGNDVDGGGLRVSTIVSNDLISSTGKTLEKTYIYGENQSSVGKLLINYTNPDFYMKERKEIVDEEFASGVPHQRILKNLFHSTNVLSELTDSYLQNNIGWYPTVREISDGSYTDYQFSLPPASNVYNNNIIETYPTNTSIPVTYPSYYVPQYHFWYQPVLNSKTIYSRPSYGVYQSILKEEFEYYPITIQPEDGEFIGFKVIPFAIKGPFTGFAPGLYNPASQTNNPYSFTGLNSLFNYATYKITKANVLLKKKTTTTIDNTNNSQLKEVVEYDYTNYSLIGKEKSQLNNDQLMTTEYKYPFSYTGITSSDMLSQGIKKLTDLNVINSPVEKSIFKSNTDGSNKRLLSSNFMSYRSDKPLPGNIAKIETSVGITNFNTSSVQGGIVQRDSRYVSKFVFDNYDINDNLLQQHQSDNIQQSYIWDYNNNYPIAQVAGSVVTDIAHTSFEADGKGNWTYTGTPAPEVTAPTGKKAFTIVNSSNNIVKSGLNAASTYIVSYWKKSGTVIVNSTTPVSGSTVDGWTYYEHKVINPPGGTITVSGTNGVIDELRLYPAGAQMTTYTYEPLIGMSSQCDANNRITYYEYDSFGRLIIVRDQDKKVLRKICYNYAGQPEACTVYGNVVRSGTFIKTCTGCQTGTSVVYTVPKDTYTAGTQVAADQLAQNDINANGQAYANANGTCTTPVTGTFKGTNQISLKNFTIGLVNINSSCSTTPYTYTLNGGSTDVSLGNLPSGNYNITVTPVGGNVFYTCTINGISQDGSSSVSFSSQPVSNGTLITITPIL